MTGRAKKYLFDILSSINSINDYLGAEKNFKTFKESKITRRAVEREFEIIGEAMNKLLNIDNLPKIKDARRVVDLRNYIIHAYDQVEVEILWGIIINKLPRLKDDVESLLKN